jgi:hypothetical protein
MPKADTTLTVVEKDLAAYKDYPFIGVHFGANLDTSGQVKNKAMADSYGSTVKVDGSVYKGTNTYITSTIASASSKTGDGIATLESGNDFSYSDKFVFSQYSFGNKNANGYGRDFLVSVKRSEDSDTKLLYSFNYHFGTNKNFLSVEAYRDGALYAVMFYDAVNHEFYGTQLEFEFLDDKTTVGESTNYNIKNNGVVVGTVTGSTYAKAA